MKMTGNMEGISDWLILNDQNEKLLLNEGDSGGILSACNRLKKGPWTSTEDAILTDYVKKHGEGNWSNIQKNTGLMRCGKSCRLRWVNHLRPNLKKGAFTKDEESLIVKLHAQMGNKWAKMAVQLPGRTDNEIKNFWNTRMKKLQRAGMPLYPPELCSVALQDRQLCDGINETSSKDRKQHTVVQAEDNGIPEVTFDKYEALQCLTDTTDVSYGDMVMKSPALLHYSFPAPVSSCCKRMRESRQPFAAFKFSNVNGFSHAYQNQNCCKDSFSMSVMQQHNPHSHTKFESFNFELPSVQSPEAQLGLWKKSGLLYPSLESVHDLPNNTPVQLESFKLKPETKSENSGLLQSVIPQFIAKTVTNPPPAMRTCSSEHTPDDGSGRLSALSSGVTDWEEGIWEEHPLNQVSPLELDSSIFHECGSTPHMKSLPDDKPADKEISEHVKSEQVGQALYKDEENGELADIFFNYSTANSLFDLGWVCQEAISMHDELPMANDPNTCILPVTDSGEDDHMMVVSGSHVLGPYPSSWGIESSSYSWHTMPSIYHSRELL